MSEEIRTEEECLALIKEYEKPTKRMSVWQGKDATIEKVLRSTNGRGIMLAFRSEILSRAKTQLLRLTNE